MFNWDSPILRKIWAGEVWENLTESYIWGGEGLIFVDFVLRNLTSIPKWRNMVKFYKKFIFGIIEPINMQISTFCCFCHQKKEFDVILIYNAWLHVLFKNLRRTSCKTHHSYTVPQNDIKFFFLMTKVIKCWNYVDRFNKYH